MANTRSTSRKIYLANQSFTTMLGKQTVNVVGGHTRVREGHPLLDGRMQFFDELTVDYDVEDAAAAPGEKRSAGAGA